MDDIDDRLFTAVIRNGHLWTAHNVGVDSAGNSNGGTRTRDAVRWFDVTVPGLTLNQSGTVFDSAGSGFLEYWMGTVMVSGQGHVAMGVNRANSATVVQAGALGRLAGDAPGTMSGFSLFQNSTTDAYDDGPFVPGPVNRWGDYTYTSLDPCDDMTMWTAQEYVAGSALWGRLGRCSREASSAGAGDARFGEPEPHTAWPGQRGRDNQLGRRPAGPAFTIHHPRSPMPAASARGRPCRGDVTVNSVTFRDPTHVTLNLSTLGAAPGADGVTITNPDGQHATGNSLIVVVVVAPPTISKVFGASTIFLNGTTSLTFTINNPNAVALTGVSFSDTLPSGLVVATPNGLSGSCGAGTIVAAAGSSSISLSGGTMPANGNCVFSVGVTGRTTGVNEGGDSADRGHRGVSTKPAAPPGLSKSLTDTVPLNAASMCPRRSSSTATDIANGCPTAAELGGPAVMASTRVTEMTVPPAASSPGSVERLPRRRFQRSRRNHWHLWCP